MSENEIRILNDDSVFTEKKAVDEILLPAEEVKEKRKQQALSPIELNENGMVVAKNNAELMRYCEAVIKSRIVPERFDEPVKLFGALMLVRSLGLPDASIRQVAVIHGTPSIFGDLPLALVQKSGKLKEFSEKWFDSKYDVISFENKNLNAEVYGAVCILKREGENQSESFSFTLDDAKTAGLYPAKSTSQPWSKYPKIMLRYKARAIALKSKFADLISGVSIAEYDHDILGSEDMRDVKETTAADKMNELLS